MAGWLRRAQWAAFFALAAALLLPLLSPGAVGAEPADVAAHAVREASGVLTRTEWGAVVVCLFALNGVLLWLRERDRRYNRIEIDRQHQEHRADLKALIEAGRTQEAEQARLAREALTENTKATQALRETLLHRGVALRGAGKP